MVVSAQPVAPSLGKALAAGCLFAWSRMTWKGHELDAEHLEQLLLAEFGAKALMSGGRESQPLAAAQANAEAYLARLADDAPNAEDRADLAAVLAFLDKK